MYSSKLVDIAHDKNWICPKCNKENDKTRLLCIHGQCDYTNIVQGQPNDIKYAQLPIEYQCELLFCGYLKQFKIKSTKIPKDIIELILKYFHIKLAWNTVKHGKNVQFIDNNTVSYFVQNETDKTPSIVIGNYIIDSNQYDTFRWKIQILNCGYPVYLGFIVLPIKPNMKWDIDTFGMMDNQNQIGIYCYHRQNGIYKTASILKDRMQPSIRRVMYQPPHSKKSIGNMSTFRFKIDFIEKICHVYHGDEVIVQTNQPINLYPKREELQKDIKIVPAALVCRDGCYCIEEIDDP